MAKFEHWTGREIDAESMMASVGEGWHPIVREFLEKADDNIVVLRVKEKFGSLRIVYRMPGEWFSGEFEENPNELAQKMLDLEAEAHEKSTCTCEVCGGAGKSFISNTGWIKTLCTKCAESGWNGRTWEEGEISLTWL